MQNRKGMTCSEAGKLGYLASKKILEEIYKGNREEYYINPSHCMECGCILPYEKRHNKFCCSSHAVSYNNRRRNKEIYNKISAKLRKNPPKKRKRKAVDINKTSTKIKYCKYCGCEKGKCIHPEVCSKYRIFNNLEKFGFNKDVIGTIDIYGEFLRVRNLIEDLYKSHISEEELKNKYNYTSGLSNFHKLLKTLNIPIRTLSEAQKESILMGKRHESSNSQYQTEWHTTWDGKEVFLRSSYEIDYANYLDENKVEYEVESLRIKYYDTQKKEYRCAIPDFYIKNKNEIIEIKSTWTLNVQNMKDKFAEYIRLGYNPKLILEHKETDIFQL